MRLEGKSILTFMYFRHAIVRISALPKPVPSVFLLRDEKNAAVRVVLGHFFFVYVHPYFDGNGRMGRFLMNAMLAAGGYQWTVIPVAELTRYMAALEAASVQNDIKPFADFHTELVKRS